MQTTPPATPESSSRAYEARRILPGKASERISLDELLSATAGEGELQLLLTVFNEGQSIESRIESWLAGGERREITRDGSRVTWNAGRALIQSPPQDWPQLEQVVTRFDQYDREFSRLEQSLLPISTGAQRDIPRAYLVEAEHMPQFDRVHQIMQQLASIRLGYVQLHPFLSHGAPDMPVASRKVLAAMFRKANFPFRRSSFANRLESCEDLYEGMMDRIVDFRWWRKGHLLEIWIIVLLVLEVVLLVGELLMKR